jgi:hypothetical protein
LLQEQEAVLEGIVVSVRRAARQERRKQFFFEKKNQKTFDR